MTESQADRVVELFERLVDLPPDQQQRFLTEHCADDAGLLTELRELLAADQRVGAMTARPLADALAHTVLSAAPAASLSRQRVGPFELREELGHGGMGVVFRAERIDGSVEQQVAIKFVRRELLNPEVRARFQLERQTLAAMDHPNIARLLDAAELDDGTPYYAMEYVHGVPISHYCEQQQLSLRERIQLFRTVCDAVAYAHRNLVVHRDLKPGNILVTEHGVPKLLDFGIAKPLQPTGAGTLAEQTATAQRYFSPLYAAPEQLLGEAISVGCDVYALGLLLCECLTGHRAFDFAGLSPGQIERLITQVPPPPPSQIANQHGASPQRQRQLRDDLDGIVLRCLRKAVRERYASVEQLAADLDNYLAGRPVEARGGQLWYRTRKFVRRNWVPVATGSLAVLALVGGVVAFAVQARIAEQRAAELEQVSAFQERMLATLDPTLVGEMLSMRVLANHSALSKSSDPLDQRSGSRLEGFRGEWEALNKTDLARSLIDEAIIAPSVSAIDREFDQQPAVAATLFRALAVAYLRIGPYESAEPLLVKAAQLHRSSLGENHPDTLLTLSWLGTAYFNQRNYEKAAEVKIAVLTGMRHVLGDDHERTIQAMASASEALARTGDFALANSLARESLEQAHRVLGDDHIHTLRALEALGNNLLAQKKPAEAEPFLRELLEERERTRGREHIKSVLALGNLVYSLAEQGK